MKKLTSALILAGSISGAQASTLLTSVFTADNAFEAYVSSSATSISSAAILSGNDWGSTYSSVDNLTTTSVSYLILKVTNQGGPGAALGTFTLSNNDYLFGNGANTISTGGTGWSMYVDSLANPASPIVAEGANGISPWGFHSGIDSSAQWVWYYNSINTNGAGAWGSDNSTVYLVTSITPAAVPVPGAIWFMGTGLLGFLGLKRKQA
ncbi:hypothetical protein CWO84_04965 [Methylomonas sp. Kb3]|uniref:hypothetical protein n=1 Tax=Methylomonas sp. Kb3 TaxID=1611544 RepID=UPI000C33CF86|nr:hypothetical protein [Methylomonas sp. Kb3]PKD41481.1 hypothetical protein CWO84_04965 [Methylomonas sp. Kb3]